MKTFYVPIMVFVFFLGFILSSLLFLQLFPFERVCEQEEVFFERCEPEIFLAEDFTVKEGYYYANVDDLRRLRCEVEKGLAFAD